MKQARRSKLWRHIDAVDEWGHRHGFGAVNGRPRCAWYWYLTPFPLLCVARERSYGVPWAVLLPNGNVHTSAQNTVTIQWGPFHFHDERPR